MGYEDGRLIRNTEGTLWPETYQGKDEVDRNIVHLFRHPHGECCPACPEGIYRSYSGGLMFQRVRNRPFTIALVLVVSENEKIGFSTKPKI